MKKVTFSFLLLSFLISLLFSLQATDYPTKVRTWIVFFKIANESKMMVFRGKVIAFDGVKTVRVLVAGRRIFVFDYKNCSSKDRAYLDSLDAPIYFNAGRTGKPLIFWYPVDESDSSGVKRIMWAKGAFDNGRKVGLWVRYWRNGKMKSLGYYRAGQKVGIWKYWDERGNLIKTEKYPEQNPVKPKG